MPARKSQRRRLRDVAARTSTRNSSTPVWPDEVDKKIEASSPADAADQIIADARSAMDDKPAPRRGAGRPSKAEVEQRNAVQNAEAVQGMKAMLEPAFLALGVAVFNDALNIPEPRWGHNQATALATAWAPVMQSQVQSPTVAALLVTLGVSLPYVVVLGQRRAEAAKQKKLSGQNVRVMEAAV